MISRWRSLLAALTAVAALWGCSAEPETGKPDDESASALSGKGDCAAADACSDVDALSPIAQLGLNDGGFYRVGDSWQVAWVFRNEDGATSCREVDGIAQGQCGVSDLGGASFTAPMVVTYKVTSVGEQRFSNAQRRTATIEVSGAANGPAPAQAIATKLEMTDSRIEYTINDLFNPVRKVYYSSGAVQRARLVDLDGRQNLTMQFDSLPNGYPNMDAIRVDSTTTCSGTFYANLFTTRGSAGTACYGTPSGILDAAERAGCPDFLLGAAQANSDSGLMQRCQVFNQVQDLADSMGLDLYTEGYLFRATDAQSDYMFWRAGDLHPSFVEGPRGFGILISQQRAE